MKPTINHPGASIGVIVRLGINLDLTCDIHDPRNARYLIPFSDAARKRWPTRWRRHPTLRPPTNLMMTRSKSKPTRCSSSALSTRAGCCATRIMLVCLVGMPRTSASPLVPVPSRRRMQGNLSLIRRA
jgi:hypothetical protein